MTTTTPETNEPPKDASTSGSVDGLLDFLRESAKELESRIAEGAEECRILCAAKEVIKNDLLQEEISIRQMKVITEQRALLVLNHALWMADIKSNEQAHRSLPEEGQ
jgi:hypothetical protein